MTNASRLGRLFTYSKDSAFIAQENFTTEALAMAIEDDPAPIVAALRRLDHAKCEELSIAAATVHPLARMADAGGGHIYHNRAARAAHVRVGLNRRDLPAVGRRPTASSSIVNQMSTISISHHTRE